VKNVIKKQILLEEIKIKTRRALAVIAQTPSLGKQKYGWSKYGGARHGLVKHSGDWYCQVCGEHQPDSLPAYMFSIDGGDNREFVRLCSVCQNKIGNESISSFKKLKEKIDIENQMNKKVVWGIYGQKKSNKR